MLERCKVDMSKPHQRVRAFVVVIALVVVTLIVLSRIAPHFVYAATPLALLFILLYLFVWGRFIAPLFKRDL